MIGKVLVVDDEVAVREFFKDIMEMSDLRVDTASGGAIALEMCEAKDYDIVITDWLMPGMNGVELIKAIKKLNRPTNPTMIIATGSHAEVANGKLDRVDAFEVILKPVDLNDFRDSVNRALKYHRGNVKA